MLETSNLGLTPNFQSGILDTSGKANDRAQSGVPWVIFTMLPIHFYHYCTAAFTRSLLVT